ncbi:MAG: PCMD domain-containing protein [Muribaculum sp.]|nr:PCMD domain-containing protein [Muribaculaceae bacterium]MCM1080884.1 PCMD domain-containing protein [Muribaculum sp.]
MNLMRKAIVWVMAAVAFAGCQKEPLNAECDIVDASLPGDQLSKAPIIENRSVTFIVKNDVSLEALAPEFTLTPGATIDPPSGTVRDFSTPQQYTVYSEDGHWNKTYTVTAKYVELALDYNFEYVKEGNTNNFKYDVFYELNHDGKESFTWASGNSGFALTGLGKDGPKVFPTFQIDEGQSGKALCLVTRKTGTFGVSFNKPLAAGNLYIGIFNVGIAVAKPLEATQFGMPFNLIPLSLKGSFKYTPGPEYCIFDKSYPGKLRPVPDTTDRFNIYAVFFDRTAPEGSTDAEKAAYEYLDGNNVLAEDNPQIICVAEIPNEMRVATESWKEFDIPFVMRPGKSIDMDKLNSGMYSITIVFSSSIDGDFFSGAEGSTLIVDNVKLICR